MCAARLQRRPAQATIEFAFVAPVLFVIFLGIFELGRLMAVWISVQHGAQEAARVASISTKSQAEIVAAAQNQTALVGAGHDVPGVRTLDCDRSWCPTAPDSPSLPTYSSVSTLVTALQLLFRPYMQPALPTSSPVTLLVWLNARAAASAAMSAAVCATRRLM